MIGTAKEGAMRTGLVIATIVGLACPAAAENPHYLPATGTTLTFRLLVTVNSGGSERTMGQVYRLTTTASDGTVAENTLTPLAVVWRCPEDDKSSTCEQARHLPDARRDGDLITVALPAEVSNALGKIGKLTVWDVFRFRQVFPFPGLQDTGEVSKPRIGDTPLVIQTTALDCDEAALKPFFPFGATARVTVPCKLTVETAQSRVSALKEGKSTSEVKYDLSFAGHEHVAVPAGSYEVAVIKFKSTPASGDGPVTEGEWEFAQNLGFSVKYSSLTHFPNSANTSRIVRELIKVER
jgi:hypothetical protein